MIFMFEDVVLQTILKYDMLQEHDKVVVAVSGGPDSMALINTLINLREKFKIQLFVAHVNHMIRPSADLETEFVMQFCKNKNVECFVKKVDVIKKAKLEKISTEEAGRNARYTFFDEVYNKTKANKIAIAHNANDNAETVIMNIIRGSGISGLKGIEPVRENKFIRPLIEVERANIEEYCAENNLDPKYDESNNENIYTRNKVRNMLIPYIKKEFNPSIVEAVNRLSDLATQEISYIDKIVLENYRDICDEEHININSPDDENTENRIVLDLKKFNLMDNFIKSKIIMLCVFKLFGSTKGIEKKHIEDVVKLCSRNIGNKYLTPNKNLKIAVKSGKITITKIVYINSN